jgi:hypothetical protein
MSFYDTQTYCGIVDMKVVVVGICNKINFTKVWIAPTKYKYQAAKIFVIFDFYHNSEG